MKLVSTLVICTSIVVTPVSAQVAPYNPAVRAAPPKFEVIPPAPRLDEDAAARERRLKAAAVVLALGWLIWIATKDRPRASDDRPTWTSKKPDIPIWLPAEVKKVEPPPPPVPAISPFYE